jgi:hypothetical protein
VPSGDQAGFWSFEVLFERLVAPEPFAAFIV